MNESETSKIFMNPKDWVEVIWGKVIDEEVYTTVAKNMLDMVTAIEDKGEEPLMLIDFSHLETITPEAADVATKTTRDLGCKKIAGFGIKPQFKGILDVIKNNSTRADSISEFATREPAEAWLLE
jgi:hypothetical protein